jgi:hypothetical protein
VLGFCLTAQRKILELQRKVLEQINSRVLDFVSGFANKETQINGICSTAQRFSSWLVSRTTPLKISELRTKRLKRSGFCAAAQRNFLEFANKVSEIDRILFSRAAKTFGIFLYPLLGHIYHRRTKFY